VSTALIVFAKAPVAGAAKTRLAPALGADGAAALAQRMLDHIVSVGCSAGFSRVEVCATPNADHPAFHHLASSHGVALDSQGDGDLGARMNRALTRALLAHERALLVGTDAPSITAHMLHNAAVALHDNDAVFIPALDGGYVLVGLRRAAPALFADMTWSTSDVMQATRNRARSQDLRWVELDPVADVDEPADLIHVPASWLSQAPARLLNVEASTP